MALSSAPGLPAQARLRAAGRSASPRGPAPCKVALPPTLVQHGDPGFAISFDNTSDARSTVVEIKATNRPGVLHAITTTFKARPWSRVSGEVAAEASPPKPLDSAWASPRPDARLDQDLALNVNKASVDMDGERLAGACGAARPQTLPRRVLLPPAPPHAPTADKFYVAAADGSKIVNKEDLANIELCLKTMARLRRSARSPAEASRSPPPLTPSPPGRRALRDEEPAER